MANETYQRGDFLANRGTPYIQGDGDLCPGNVGGQIVPIPFTGNYTAGATGVNAAYAGSTVTKFVPYKPGSIVGISIYGNAAVTDGHVSATVYIGATSTGFAAALSSVAGNTRSDTASQVKDTDTFAAGAAISVKLDLAATNTANTVGVTLFVEM